MAVPSWWQEFFLANNLVRARIAALEHELDRFSDHEDSALTLVPSMVASLLQAPFAVLYTVEPGCSVARPDRLFLEGFDSAAGEAFVDFARTSRGTWAAYSPRRVEKLQQNKVLTVMQLKKSWLANAKHVELYQRLGVGEATQARALICDGPNMLGWVGGFQFDVFRREQTSALQALVPALLKRLKIERELEGAGGLRLALDAIEPPAFLMRKSRLIDANTAGQVRLDADPTFRAVLSDLCRIPVLPPHVDRTELVQRGGQRLTLLIVRDDSLRAAQLSRTFAARCALTPRQSAVLSLVVQGLSNRAIAAHLELTVRAVELHLTAIYERGQIDGRTELVSRVLLGK